jgi:hypothetical protein
MPGEMNVDVLVVGAGLGGVAASIAAAEQGVTVMLVEQSNWIGGQLTAQGVCTPDEDTLDGQAVVEMYGSTASYRDLKTRIRQWYRTNTTLSPTGQAQTSLNMGRCWVNTGFAVEPAVAIGVLEQMLSEAGVTPVLSAKVSGQALAGARLISSVTVLESDGSSTTVTPKFVLDSTETGDLLPMFGLPYAIGAEARADTGEPDAPPDAHPEWIQPVTYPFALSRGLVGQDFTIDKPANYDQLNQSLKFSLVDGDITAMFSGKAPFWTYRRIVDHTIFSDPRYTHDVATINVKANDYIGGIYPDDSNSGNNAAVLDAARGVSLAYLYWLQTEAPRDDGSPESGWPEFLPLTTFFNTSDAISPAPYIRESRRIIPITRITQQSLDADFNPGPRGNIFPDSCGIGNYGMDVHAGANGGPELQKPTKPYQIPAGALVPKACDNLIASGKCLGATHITNGAYRLHPQEWNVGEAAGALAAFCVHTGSTPAAVLASADALAQYQNVLLGRGVPLFWWSDVLGNPFWAHINMVGVRKAFSGDTDSLAFRPGDPFEEGDKAPVQASIGKPLNWPPLPMTRAKAAQFVASQMGWVQ